MTTTEESTVVATVILYGTLANDIALRRGRTRFVLLVPTDLNDQPVEQLVLVEGDAAEALVGTPQGAGLFVTGELYYETDTAEDEYHEHGWQVRATRVGLEVGAP